MSLARTFAVIALVGCTSSNEGATTTPDPGSSKDGGYSPSSPSPSFTEVTHPSPAPPPYVECTPSFTDPCVVYDFSEEYFDLSDRDWYLGSPRTVVVDESAVYWTNDMGLEKVPKAGTAIGVDSHVSLYSVNPKAYENIAAFAVDATSIYFQAGSYPSRPLRRMPKSGGVAPVLLTAADSVSEVAVDATDVYFTGPILGRVPLTGGTATPLSNSVAYGPLEIDDTHVYVRTDGDILRFSKSGGAPTTLFEGSGGKLTRLGSKLYFDSNVASLIQIVAVPVEGGLAEPIDASSSTFHVLTAHGDALYALNESTYMNSVVRRIPVNGSAQGQLTISGFGSGRLAVDSSGVYWLGWRRTCLLEARYPGTGRFDPGYSICRKGLSETLILRLPLVF